MARVTTQALENLCDSRIQRKSDKTTFVSGQCDVPSSPQFGPSMVPSQNQ
jgi:hypothetical protein